MMTSNTQQNFRIFSLSVVVFLMAGTLSLAAETVKMANGLTINLVTAEDIAADSDLCPISLAATDARYVSYDRAQVLDALEAMHGFETALDVNVYLLPAPPAAINSSYASRNNVFLAPGTGQIPASTQAYIVTHEMGHVLTWAFMDDSSSRWGEYMSLRGLSLEDNGPDAQHADRAREIVAEDFRYLFGGNLATDSGSIENHDLRTPDQVLGLRELMAGFLAERPVVEVEKIVAQAFPNPCNPRTTIAMALPAGSNASQIRLSVYDVRGALVRTIDGGLVSNGQVMVDWNGDNDAGNGVSSGRYLYILQADGIQAQGSLTLVR